MQDYQIVCFEIVYAKYFIFQKVLSWNYYLLLAFIYLSVEHTHCAPTLASASPFPLYTINDPQLLLEI